jgi:hypothetical protein
MTRGISRKQRLAEQLHASRVQSAATWGSAAKKPPRAWANEAFQPDDQAKRN